MELGTNSDETTAMTTKDQAAALARIEVERRKRMACKEPGCDGLVEYVATLDPGDDEGMGAEFLVQCPKCKRIDVSARL